MSEEEAFEYDDELDWIARKKALSLELQEAEVEIDSLYERISALRTLNLEFGAAIA